MELLRHLSSIIYNIYINIIYNIIKVYPDEDNIKMFADDIIIYFTSDGNMDLKRIIYNIKLNSAFSADNRTIDE